MSDTPRESAQPKSEVDDLKNRIRLLLEACAERKQACFACGAPMYFVRMTKSGKLNPYTVSGVSHFADCPDAELFRRAWAQAKAGAL